MIQFLNCAAYLNGLFNFIPRFQQHTCTCFVILLMYVAREVALGLYKRSYNSHNFEENVQNQSYYLTQLFPYLTTDVHQWNSF